MTASAIRGTCFGYEVRSALPFEFLRGGEGEPLEVVASSDGRAGPDDELLLDWERSPERPFCARLYSDGSRYRLWVRDGGWFGVEPGVPRVHVPAREDAIRREERVWGVPAILCFLARGDLPLHAAAVEVEGRAILLAAPGTFGKTTLAAAFLRAGHRVLSEDVSCVRLLPEPAVLPGPALLRVRRDVANRLDLPFGRVVAEDEERLHLSLDERERGDCRPVPLGAALLLRTGDCFGLERAPTPDAIRDLWALSFRLPSEDDFARCFAAVSDLVRSVPVWNLSRRLRFDTLAATVERVSAHV